MPIPYPGIQPIYTLLIRYESYDMIWMVQDFWIYPKEHSKLELTAIFMKQDEHKHDENAKE